MGRMAGDATFRLDHRMLKDKWPSGFGVALHTNRIHVSI